MTKLNKLSACAALQLLHKKEISPLELLNAHINAIESTSNLNQYITTTFEYATAQAKLSQSRYLNGEAFILDGLPIGVKDVFCTNGVKTTSGSKILENFVPTYESTVTANLFGHGAIMLGKNNMDEFAMGSSNVYSAFGRCVNPWKKNNSDEELVPGGSSGGPAAAVSSFTAIAALGSDTGGSVRQPAAFCGIFGFKPSYGACSRYGIISLASSMDQAGIFARTLEDTALFTEVMMGYDPKDSTSAKIPVPDLKNAIKRDLKGLRIGVPKEYMDDSLSKELRDLVKESIRGLEAQGAYVTEVSLPHSKYGVAAYYIILPAEASSNLARYDGVRYGLRVFKEGDTLEEMYKNTRTDGLGVEVQRRVMIGTYVLSAGMYDGYFARAQKVRKLIAVDFCNVFENVDALLTPVTTGSAFAFDDKVRMDPIAMYYNDVFTIPVNLAGLPAMSVPCKLDSTGLPIGVQIISNKFCDATVFACAGGLDRYFKFNYAPKGY